MKVAYTNSLAYKLEQRINTLAHNVILRSDLVDLGGERQVSYALKQLIRQKKLVRVGYGLYAKVEPSLYGNNATLTAPRGFAGMVREALDRLNIPWQPSEAEEAYNLGLSTQVPAKSILRIKKRFRRKISYKGTSFQFKQAN